MKKVVVHKVVPPQKGWFYYFDKNMNLCRSKMLHGGEKKRFPKEFVTRTGIKREHGYLYYCDKSGDVWKEEVTRGDPLKKEKKFHRFEDL